MEGVPLENDGGSASAGSHWERAMLYNEVIKFFNYINKN